jgi:hypothetical protein
MRFKVLMLAACMATVPGCTKHAATVGKAPPAPAPTPAQPPAISPDLAARLAVLAHDADPDVLRMAVQAQQCAAQRGDVASGGRLAVIDYSLPSTQRRLWVFDLSRESLLYSEHVAHGRNTGENLATRFSNIDGSFQSSLGLFRTAETYVGENGYSMRMDGLEPGVNDLARPRAIVMHGAWYVDPLQATRQGRLGRSLGCPAVRPQVAREVIDTLKQGQLLFAYYPDRDWLDSSRYLDCRRDEPPRQRQASLHAPAR